MNKSILILAACFYCIQAFPQQRCGTDEYYESLYNRHPELIQYRTNYENLMQDYTSVPNGRTISITNIPVVVHLIGDDVISTISSAKVQEQITILNNAYNGSNSIGANTQVQFCLATVNSFGQATNGIVDIHGSFPSVWDVSAADNDPNSEMSLKTLSHWDPVNYLNIWVVTNLQDGSLALYGVATFPESLNSEPYKDGVIVIMGAFGNNSDPYSNLGLTAVHEVGHWLGLYHTFQRGIFNTEGACLNTNCSNNGDLICDTPPEQGSSSSCSSNNTCHTDNPDLNDPIENYMDYSPDACLTTFTPDQAIRINNTISTTRFGIISSLGCSTAAITSICGNGIIEPGEQCDPPSPDCNLNCQMIINNGQGNICDNYFFDFETGDNCISNLTGRGMLINGNASGVPIISDIPIVLSAISRCPDQCGGWWDGDLSGTTVSTFSSACNSDCHTGLDFWNCDCFFQHYYIEMVEVDANLNWIGSVRGDWITKQTPYFTWHFNHIDVDRNTLSQINMQLIQGRYYRIKLAFTDEAQWLEYSRYFQYSGLPIHSELACSGSDLVINQGYWNLHNFSDFGNFGASNSITTSGSLTVSVHNYWTAGNNIQFNPGFYVPSGVEFTAEIYPCGSSSAHPANNNSPNTYNTNRSSSNQAPTNYKPSAKDNGTSAGFSMIPNPNNGAFTIQFDVNNEEEKQLFIYNSWGHQINMKDKISSSKLDLDLSSEPKGVYWIKVMQGSKISTQKIVLM